MSIKYVLPKTAKELTSLVDSAIRSAKTMRDKVQVASVAILHHAYLHGDYTAANALIEGLGFGVKRDSLVEWFVVYGGLIIDDESKSFGSWQGKEFIKANFEGAKETHWYTLKKQDNAFESYQFEVELKKFINRASKLKTKVSKMDQSDQDKYDFNVSDAVVSQLLQLASFEAIIAEDAPANDPATEEIKKIMEVAG